VPFADGNPVASVTATAANGIAFRITASVRRAVSMPVLNLQEGMME
jgi:hypothetical protein